MKIRVTEHTVADGITGNGFTVGKEYEVLKEVDSFFRKYYNVVDDTGAHRYLNTNSVEIVEEHPSESSEQALKESSEIEYRFPYPTEETSSIKIEDSPFETAQEKSYISIDTILSSLKDTPIALVIDQLNGSPSFRIECEIDQDVSLFEFDNISDAMKAIDCLKFLLEHKQ